MEGGTPLAATVAFAYAQALERGAAPADAYALAKQTPVKDKSRLNLFEMLHAFPGFYFVAEGDPLCDLAETLQSNNVFVVFVRSSFDKESVPFEEAFSFGPSSNGIQRIVSGEFVPGKDILSLLKNYVYAIVFAKSVPPHAVSAALTTVHAVLQQEHEKEPETPQQQPPQQQETPAAPVKKPGPARGQKRERPLAVPVVSEELPPNNKKPEVGTEEK